MLAHLAGTLRTCTVHHQPCELCSGSIASDKHETCWFVHAGSKSSLSLNIEQREASSSESGNPNSSSNSWTSSQPLPISSFLQPDNSIPPKLMPPSNSSSRLREQLRLGWVRLEYLADWLVVVIAIIALAASERTRPREGELLA